MRGFSTYSLIVGVLSQLNKDMSLTTVVLVGRPNVGKSTLFNRLSLNRRAITHDAPGITRDRHYAEAALGDLTFRLIDTAGLFTLPKGEKQSLAAQSHFQTRSAVEEADVILFMVDGIEGPTLEDRIIAQTLHKIHKPIVLLINKAESKEARRHLVEFSTLGFDNTVALSAEHKEGFADLFEVLMPWVNTPSAEETESKDPSLVLAIIGRPNVGKSTFINQVLGENRVVTSPEAGTTRDTIEIAFQFKKHPFLLIDTAGLRRQSRVITLLEKQIVAQTHRAIQYAECVILMLDATHPLEKQDLTMARQVEEEGRAMVIVVNKIDQVQAPEPFLRRLREEIEQFLPQIKGVPLVAVSSLEGVNLDAVFEEVLSVHKVWNKRLPTAALNRWLEDVINQNPPPLVQGRSLKIRYVTQIKTRPPTFALFVTRAQEFPETYLRYLRNQLREAFSFWGVPLRLLLRSSKNPFA